MANASTRVLFRTVQTLTNSQVSGLSDRELLQRFVSEEDQPAFAAIVARHSGMVLGVCRRKLSSVHDAEDACQAVFLLLAKKANSTRWRSSVANWLYVTARNVAHNARLSADRRVVRENQVAISEAITPVDSMTVGELSAILDEELDKLPPRYREPLVLCYLEGLTRDEAAAQLAVPEATLKSQLERGRKKLAEALTSRGCTLGMTLLVTATTFHATAASPKLVDSILASLSGKPSDSVSVLLNQITGKGILTKMKLFLLSGLGLSVLVLGLSAAQSTSEPKEKSMPKLENQDKAAGSSLSTPKFRADAPIKDARYSPDGKKIVGHAQNALYIWDSKGGELLRKIDTKMEALPDPTSHTELGMPFAVHPKNTRVACGGMKEGRTILQIWDYESGKLLVEKPSSCNALKLLAWTPDGKGLLERSNIGWEKETGWKLIVHTDQLEELHSHDLPTSEGTWHPVLVPLPNNKEALVWQNRQRPLIIDLESGSTVLTIDYLPGISSDVAISPDGKNLLLSSTNELFLYDLPSGKKNKQLPVTRTGWEKYRPMFSPDSKTVYVWDHRPMAYEVATGKRIWQAVSPTFFGRAMLQRDLSPDGSTILLRVGNSLGFLDVQSGNERNIGASPCRPASMIWSRDGKILFTRVDEYAQERTWTAWDVATGKQLYQLQPTHLKDDQWKMLPDLFFLSGGKEILVGIETTNSYETSASKELVVFDTQTGKQKRLLTDRLPLEEFRWIHPIGVDEKNSVVVMQTYTVRRFEQMDHATFRWDVTKRKKLQEWIVEGDRTQSSRHYDPYYVTVLQSRPVVNSPKKPDPAKVRFYSQVDGKIIHELLLDLPVCQVDRMEGNFFVTESYAQKWILRGNTYRSQPIFPIAYDYWELPSRERIRLFEQEQSSLVVLGPKGKYVVRVVDNHSFEIYEPLVLKKAILKVKTPYRVERLEFSPDGTKLAASLADTSILIWDTTPWQKAIAEQLTKALPKDISPLVVDLSKGIEPGLRASRLLSVAGDQAVQLLEEKVSVKKMLDEVKINQWIKDLESERFAVREKAEKDLRELSDQVEVHLRKALDKNPAPEGRQRIAKLIKEIESRKLFSSECRELRAVQALKWMNSESARRLLTKWSQGNPSANLTKAAKEALR